MTSTLPRSIESAELLAPARAVIRNPLFDEAGLPTRIAFQVAMRPEHWGGLARVAWILGWSGGAESLRDASTRARHAAEELIRLADTHRSVMLVGHGMLNTLIARALRGRGWVGGGATRTYWGLVSLKVARTTSRPGIQ